MTSPTTQNLYKNIFLRVIRGNRSVADVLKKARNTKSSSTWFNNRAALLYWSRHEAHLFKGELNSSEIPDEIRSLPADFLWQLHQKFKDAPPLPKEKRRARHSKRRDLKYAPSGWRESLLKEPSLRKHILSFALSAVTGCRPGELVKNFKVTLTKSEVEFEISGLKVTEYSGQPYRKIAYSLPRLPNLFLDLIISVVKGVLRGAEGVLEIPSCDPKKYSAAITSASLRLGWGGKRGLSAYCLRHAFASDLKAAGKSRQDIAKALGHCSEKTQSCYGQARMSSGGGVVPDRIEAARSVKPLASDVATRLGSAKPVPRVRR